MPTKSINSSSLASRAVELIRKRRMVRSRDLVRSGVTRATLRRLLHEERIERLDRGIYGLPGADLGEKQTLLEASLRVPSGVVCLLSALQFHELTTQNPPEVWIAIGHKARPPATKRIPLRIVRLSGSAFTSGVVEHRIHGIPVRVYSPAKTVADCFKFRNTIGLDVAIEALRDCRRQRQATVDELWTAAKINRVGQIMRPYLEALA